MDGENFMENPYFFNGWFGGKHTIFGNNHMDVIGCVWLGLWTDQWWTDQSVFSPILINEVFCWSYNPLILIFDPNFLGHPSIQLGVFCRKNLGGKDKGFKLSWYIGHQHPLEIGWHTFDGKDPAPLMMPEMLFLFQCQNLFGHPKVVQDFFHQPYWYQRRFIHWCILEPRMFRSWSSRPMRQGFGSNKSSISLSKSSNLLMVQKFCTT